MLEKIKGYLIGVALRKYLPMGAMAAVAALGGLLAAHSGLLETWGITYGVWPFQWDPGQQPVGPCILIELGTLSAKTIAAIVSLITVLLSAMQHHVSPTTSPQKPVAAPPEGQV